MYEHLTCIESLKSLVCTFDMKLQCQENFFSKVKEKSLATEVLTVENGIPKLEIAIAGTGLFTGSQEVTTTWTYWAIQGPDGISYSQGHGSNNDQGWS